MLPQSSTRVESSVSAGRSACCERTWNRADRSAAAARYRAWVGWSGSRMTRPSSPSMMAIRHCRARSRNLPRPTTAGISSAAATMAVWLARPPASVAKPEHALRVQPRRLARRQVLGQDQGGSRQLVLERLGSLADQLAEDPGLDVAHVGGAGRQVESLSRSRRVACASRTSMTACSAAIRSRSIRARVSARSVGSPIIWAWAARMSAYWGPSRLPSFRPRPARPRGRQPPARDRAGPARRSTASGAIFRGGSRMPRGSSTTTGPIAIPGLTAMPRSTCMGGASVVGSVAEFGEAGGGMPSFL